MIKRYGILSRYCKEIKDIENKIIDYHGNVLGREDEISSQLALEITKNFMEKFKKSFNNKNLNGVKFKVELYKYKPKTEESIAGADLGGIVELNYLGNKIIKAYLAQAKIGKIKRKGFIRKCDRIYCYDKNIQEQAKKMLNFTSDSFFFIYSNVGFYVVPANEIRLYGKNSIKTGEVNIRRLENFYELFLTCFVGDHKFAKFYKNINDLEIFAKEFNIKNLLHMKVNVPAE